MRARSGAARRRDRGVAAARARGRRDRPLRHRRRRARRRRDRRRRARADLDHRRQPRPSGVRRPRRVRPPPRTTAGGTWRSPKARTCASASTSRGSRRARRSRRCSNGSPTAPRPRAPVDDPRPGVPQAARAERHLGRPGLGPASAPRTQRAKLGDRVDVVELARARVAPGSRVTATSLSATPPRPSGRTLTIRAPSREATHSASSPPPNSSAAQSSAAYPRAGARRRPPRGRPAPLGLGVAGGPTGCRQQAEPLDGLRRAAARADAALEPAHRAGADPCQHHARFPRRPHRLVDPVLAPDREHVAHRSAADVDRVLREQVLDRIDPLSPRWNSDSTLGSHGHGSKRSRKRITRSPRSPLAVGRKQIFGTGFPVSVRTSGRAPGCVRAS